MKCPHCNGTGTTPGPRRGTGHLQDRILAALEVGPLTQAELSEWTGSSRQSISRALSGLRARGLVYADVQPGDTYHTLTKD